MRIVGLLCWYDESPMWLHATITSMVRAGCDALVAVDGAYASFPNAKQHSPSIQAEAVRSAADAAGMELLLHTPRQLWWGGQVEKRDHMFRLAATITTPHRDWLFVLDADEVVTQADPNAIRRELYATSADTASVYLWQYDDPAQTPAKERISQQHATDNTHAAHTRRYFRCLDDMRCEYAHSIFMGTTKHGERVSMRAEEHAPRVGATPATHYDLETPVWVEHRNPMRERKRIIEKHQFYTDRRKRGLEETPDGFRV